MPGPQAEAAPISVRFTNDSEELVDLLWHREMEGGLVVGQPLSEILPGRSRVIRSYSGHSFSMWQNDNEIQHWTMGKEKRQHYKLSSASRVPPVPLTAAPSKTSPAPTTTTIDARKQLDPRVLTEARQLVVQGKYRDALALFRTVEIDATERPKLAARVANLERIVAGEDMIKGRVASTSTPRTSETAKTAQNAPAGKELWCLHPACLESLKTYATPAELAAHEAAHHSFFVHSAAKATSAVPRCDKCTLHVPCGKVHATKRTYAEVRESSCTACIAYAMTPRVCHCRWSHPNKKIHATMMQHGVCRRRRSQSARGRGRLQ